MGSFDDIFDMITDELIGDDIYESLEEYERNKKLPSITTLPFSKLSPVKIDEVKKIKTGIFGRIKKQFVKGIVEGKTTFAEFPGSMPLCPSPDKQTAQPAFSETHVVSSQNAF